METSERNAQADLTSLTDGELDALILGQLTKWCRAGVSLEEIGEALMGFGSDHIAEIMSINYVWDKKSQAVYRSPGDMTDFGKRSKAARAPN